MVLGLGGNAELAEFLGWFLNLPETQARLRSFHSGSSVPFVPVGAVESLEVPVPSRALQRKIVKLQVLRAVDQRLVEDIQQRRRVMIDTVLRLAVEREAAGRPSKPPGVGEQTGPQPERADSRRQTDWGLDRKQR
jgi:hypothetical protein